MKTTLKDTIRDLVVKPLYEQWYPEKMQQAHDHLSARQEHQESTEAGRTAYLWATLAWVKVRGSKLYPLGYDASVEPVEINDAVITQTEGIRFEDARGEEFLLTGGRVIHQGEIVMQASEMLTALGTGAAPDAWVTEIPQRAAPGLACE